MDIIESIAWFLAGVGIFLIGMKIMGENLENTAGKSLRRIFDKLNNNKIVGVGIGIGTTVLTQSSSATTVMIVGFANAGIMSLVQATSIIMGANIGTTITTQLMALSFLSQVFMCLAFIGAIMTMVCKGKAKSIGAILTGVGMIFVGMDVMKLGVGGIKDLPVVGEIFLSANNMPLVMLLVGAVLTMIIQSSAATTGIVMSFIIATGTDGAPLMSLTSAMYALIGANIGTCITAVLASLGTNIHGKRVAVMHTLFNFIGAIFFVILLLIGVPFANWLEMLFPNIPETQVAMFHTFFNVVTTLILLFFIKPLAKFVMLIVPERKKDQENALKLSYLDENILTNGPIAVAQMRKELVNMAEIARLNLNRGMNALISLDTSEKEAMEQSEAKLDFLDKEITKYLVKMAGLELSEHDDKKIGSFYHVVIDLERIGDYAKNLMEYAEHAKDDDVTFSAEAIEEMKQLWKMVDDQLELCISAFAKVSLVDEAKVEADEEAIDSYVTKLQNTHIARLNQGICNPSASQIFSSLTLSMERVADHVRNIYITMKEYAKKPVTVQATTIEE